MTTDSAAEAANDRIEAFNAEACGLEPIDGGDQVASGDDPADPGAPVFDPANGSIRDQTVALFVSRGFTEDEAGCLFDNMDLQDPELATNQESLLALVEACDLDLERLAGLGG